MIAEATHRTMDADMTRKLTIVVPTHNRYPFLARLLRYYRACGAPVPMHILDSSRDALPAAVEQLLDARGITHTRHDADQRLFSKLHEGLRQVTTPYAVFWADDDLMVPRSLIEAARFLERHSDFSMAHGVSGYFTTRPLQDETAVGDIGPLPQRSWEGETASARLRNYLRGGGSTFYSVHRTGDLQRYLEECVRHGFALFWAELVLACLSVIQGKAHKLDNLYIMRGIHDGRGEGWDKADRHDVFDWVAGTEFPERCGRFLGVISTALAQRDGISERFARELAKEAFWGYLGFVLPRQWEARYGDPGRALHVRVRQAARRIPGVRTAWRAARGLLPHPSDEISLIALRRRFSPYHAEFNLIEQAVTRRG